MLEILRDAIRANVNLGIPDFRNKDGYDLWAKILLDQDTWGDINSIDELYQEDAAYLFIQSYLQLVRLLCELGKIPVFEIPKLIHLSKESEETNRYRLEFEIQEIQFIPHTAYEIAMKVSLELCQWMVINSPNSENINKVFNTIHEKIMQPLHKLVPGRKSTIPVLRVAHDLGIPMMHLGMGAYQLGWGSKSRVLAGSISELDSVIGSSLSTVKSATANLLSMAGLPAPKHFVANSINEALTAGEKLGFPVVVKPLDQERGLGVNVDIDNPVALQKAFLIAQEHSQTGAVLVERQVTGVCHRIFIANGQLLYVVKRLPTSIAGDGKRTIEVILRDEWSAQNQKPPWLRSPIPPLDALALDSITKAGYFLDSIPAKRQLVPLRRIESSEWGGVDEDLTKCIHQDNIEIAIRAAQLLHLNHAGIDIITEDISRPWYETGAIINEVNISPLLGGGTISRSYLPQFFANFIDGDGTIPIEIFKTEMAALVFQKQSINQGKRCFITSNIKTKDCNGKELMMPFKEIKQRLKALIMRSDVDLVAVVEP